MKTRPARLLFIIVAAIAFFASPRQCSAQAVPDTTNNHTRVDISKNDTGVTAPDTAKVPATVVNEGSEANDSLKPHPFQPDPKKAGMYSAILPGLGQLYNKQYWKIPVIYGGLGVATYFIITNLQNYQSYYKAYVGRVNNPYPTDPYIIYKNGQFVGYIYTEPQLLQLENDYSKYLDLTVLFTGIGFALQVMDAITSAHLKNFDISRDISLQMKPVFLPGGVGMGLVMGFK